MELFPRFVGATGRQIGPICRKIWETFFELRPPFPGTKIFRKKMSAQLIPSAPAPAAGAPCTSAADKAALTARARALVQAGGRSPLADVLTNARLHTACAPHRPCTVDAPDRLGVLRKRQRKCPRVMDRLQRRRIQ